MKRIQETGAELIFTNYFIVSKVKQYIYGVPLGSKVCTSDKSEIHNLWEESSINEKDWSNFHEKDPRNILFIISLNIFILSMCN